jgi:hypothetical protein
MTSRRFQRRLLPAGIGIGIFVLVVGLTLQTTFSDPRVGQDFRFYRDVALHWLTTGQLYLPHQLEGEYHLALMVDVLYPPTALLLFVPFALVPGWLAAMAWWGIPAAVVARQAWVQRPGPWTWPVVGLLLLWPRSYGSIAWGNTDIWLVTFVSAGLLWGWPAVLVLLKPTFAPFALVGIGRRSWWIAAAGLALFSLAALPLWFDYVQAMLRVRGLQLDYSVFNLPIVLVPLALHLGRRRLVAVSQPAPALGRGGELGEGAAAT